MDVPSFSILKVNSSRPWGIGDNCNALQGRYCIGMTLKPARREQINAGEVTGVVMGSFQVNKTRKRLSSFWYSYSGNLNFVH